MIIGIILLLVLTGVGIYLDKTLFLFADTFFFTAIAISCGIICFVICCAAEWVVEKITKSINQSKE